MENDRNMYSCIVLSGGMSRRMGEDKGSMIIQDKPMILHILSKLSGKINDVVIVLNDSERVAIYESILNSYCKDNIYNEFDYDLTFKIDEVEDKGPLCGIMTGLKSIDTDYALILPCDSPYIKEDFIDYMFNLLENNDFPDALIPYNNFINHEKDILDRSCCEQSVSNLSIEDKIKQCEPLHAIYSKKSFLIMEELLKKDELFVKSFIRKISNKSFVLIDDDKIKSINFKNLNRIEDIE